MATIQLEGLSNVREMLAAVGPGLEKANEKAQNRMAYALMQAEREQAKASLANPTPFSVSSIVYKKVGEPSFKVGALTVPTPNIPGAGVFVGDLFKQFGADEEHYLGVQIFGGQTAGPRKSELALQAMGMMPPGYVWAPAKNLVLNAYGNVRPAGIGSMLADLKRNGRRGENYVVIGKPGQEKAVLTKVGDEWYPYLYFIKPASYSERYGFYDRANAEVGQKFPTILREEVEKALAQAVGG